MCKYVFFIILLVWFVDAFAEVNIVVPVATTHIEYSEEEYNNINRGLGVEYTYDRSHTFGALYLNKDSFNNENIYFYYGKKYQTEKDYSFSLSGLFASSYDAGVFSPLISLSYSYLRIVTTYPFGMISGVNSDMVNVQLVIPVKF